MLDRERLKVSDGRVESTDVVYDDLGEQRDVRRPPRDPSEDSSKST